MTICEHCGAPLRVSGRWPGDAPPILAGVWELHWEHADAAHDHDAQPAPELPLEAQEGAQEP